MSEDTADPTSGWAHHDLEMAPGGPQALARGCRCSVLANAAYRTRATDQPFVDPCCPLHGRGEPDPPQS